MSWNNSGKAAWNSGGSGGDAAGASSWGRAGDAGDSEGCAWGADGVASSGARRICHEEGHFARDCPQKPEGGGWIGECFNCGQFGHHKADCTNKRTERPFHGACHVCGEEGHAARSCPKQTCKLCSSEGHRMADCTSRRLVDWTGIPELEPAEAWCTVVDAGEKQDLDKFRLSLRAYARALGDKFNLVAVEEALRADELPIFLIALKQDLAANLTIVDLLGNPDREFVLTVQRRAKPRRAVLAEGWPDSATTNYKRLASCGDIKDSGRPFCYNCHEVGHTRKHCKDNVEESKPVRPAITCVNCKEEGHRARDCTKPRIDPFACRNCKQESHASKDCPKPRSAEGIICNKCNEIGHFSRDCPNAEARPPRTCRNCGSEDHIAKDCEHPRNPDNVACRNCEKLGHFSKDCPEPKDWSKVTCSNRCEKGHTYKRCQAGPTEDNSMGAGGAVRETSGGWGNNISAANNTAGGETTWNTGNGGW